MFSLRITLWWMKLLGRFSRHIAVADSEDNGFTGDAAWLYRAIGKLEGRFGALEQRVQNADITNDRRMETLTGKVNQLPEAIDQKVSDLGDTISKHINTVNTKVDEIKDSLQAMKIADANSRGKFSGGWLVLTVICTAAVGVVGLILGVLNYMKP